MKPDVFQLHKNLTLALVALVLVSMATCAMARATYVPNQYIIHVKAGTTLSAVKSAANQMGASVIDSLPLADTYLVQMGKSVGSNPYHATAASKWVIDSIQPNCKYYATATPNDPDWEKQWNMPLINMPAVWDTQKGNDSITVAVLDTGVAYEHPDLKDRIAYDNNNAVLGIDTIDGDTDPNDEDGHGTHVSGIIAAQGDNDIGVTGVCWDGVRIMPIRVLGTDGGSTDAVVKGLDYALTKDAQVVNMSLGGSVGDEAIHQKIIELVNAGIIVCASTGNSGDEADHSVAYPAAYNECIAVAAVGPDDSIAYYSSYGPKTQVDIAAPGGDYKQGFDAQVYSTWVTFTRDTDGAITERDYSYGYEQGTSMACPHVAGAAAMLLISGVPPSQVRSQLLFSSRIPATDYDPIKYGSGILDVQAALGKARLKILKPGNGQTVGSRPQVTIDSRGIQSTSVKVYVDYVDADNNGEPDNIAGETSVIDGSNIANYIDSSLTTISFQWPIEGKSAFTPGFHRIYVVGNSLAGTVCEDSSVFTVASKVIPAGIYLFAFPFDVDTSVVKPSDILLQADFHSDASARSRLLRWIPTPTNVATSTMPYGYATYDPDSTSEYCWLNQSLVLSSSVTLPTSGGSLYEFDALMGGRTLSRVPVVGSGYWLILAQDSAIDETNNTLDAMSTFDKSKGYSVRLYKGWNMIGNPYGHTVPWLSCLFTYRGETKMLDDAVSAGWIKSTLYGYDSTVSKEYQRIGDRDNLEPYGGYWLRATVGGITDPLSVIILP